MRISNRLPLHLPAARPALYRTSGTKRIAAVDFLSRWASNVRCFVAHTHARAGKIYHAKENDRHTLSIFIDPARMEEATEYGGSSAAIEAAAERVFGKLDDVMCRVTDNFTVQLQTVEGFSAVEPEESTANYYIHVRAKGTDDHEVAFFWVTITLSMRDIADNALLGFERQAWRSISEMFGIRDG